VAQVSRGGDELLLSPVRRRIVAALTALPPSGPEDSSDNGSEAGSQPQSTGLTAAEVGAAVQLHPTSARFHLEQLVAAGVLTASFHRHGTGRPRKRYAVHAGHRSRVDPETSYRMLAELLTQAVAPQQSGDRLSPEEAGARWARQHLRPLDGAVPAPARTPGQWLATTGRVVDFLEAWGYEPSVRTEVGGHTATVVLGRCPFLELARAHTDVVCAAHLGLLKGALEALGEVDTEVRLAPFAERGACRAQLTTRAHLTPPEISPVTTIPDQEDDA
jgi:predicted ArsR family transcriptional regulator